MSSTSDWLDQATGRAPALLRDLALFHDYFAIRGGGERLMLTLAAALGGTLVFGYRTATSYDNDMFPTSRRDLMLPTVLRGSGVRPLALSVLFARQRRMAATTGVRVFSGVAAPFAAPELSAGGRNIFYCHTPPRFLFDQREHFLGRMSGPSQLLARPLLAQYERGYRRAVARMSVVVANSETTQRRIGRYLGIDSTVVYPPTDIDRFCWAPPQGYYLSTARLTSLKRVDTIVEAFVAMPDKRLIVTSGGEDAGKLAARAAGAPNITFTGWTDDAALSRLMAGAIATVYVPRDEDFGMSPIESMAAGKPVIGVAEGGLVETIVPGETGMLLPRDFSTLQLIEAIRAMTPELAARMRQACQNRAELFSERRFVDRMTEIVTGTGQRSE